MQRLFFITSIVTLFLLGACGNESRALQQSLKVAGENRHELERVLEHYSVNKYDSLKYRAAKFLIENMPGHYSYAGEDILKYNEDITPILKNRELSLSQLKFKMDSISEMYPNLNSNLVEDIQVITSEYLIYSIDKAFEAWDKPWARHLSFEEFCEALLPYKVTELQPFDYWRDTLAAKFPIINPYDDNVEYTATPYNHYNNLIRSIKEIVDIKIELLGSDRRYIPLSASNISLLRFGTCSNYVDLLAAIMRANGIPVYKEHFPQWGKFGNTGHSFLSLVNKSNINLPYRDVDDRTYTGGLYQDNNIPKVYRSCYALNHNKIEYLKKAKYRDARINPFTFDITSDYYSTSNISLDISEEGMKDKYYYLAIFVNGQWEPLDYSKYQKGYVTFERVGRANLYIILGYDSYKLTPVSDPFVLELNGDITPYKANLLERESVKLYRKYYKEIQLYHYEQRARGSIEASNRSDFKDPSLICNIDTPGQFIKCESSEKYRYWRFYSPPNGWCNIAELQFYANNIKTPLKGEIITNIDIPLDVYYVEQTFDGDWLTNVHSQEANDSWIGLDFGEPKSVDYILCVPRSDDNNIHIGDMYELRYWSDNQWNVHEQKIAVDNPIIFDDVPTNAILWLRNIDRGVQERIFTYQKGKQSWW